jgi:hypothetical protein
MARSGLIIKLRDTKTISTFDGTGDNQSYREDCRKNGEYEYFEN